MPCQNRYGCRCEYQKKENYNTALRKFPNLPENPLKNWECNQTEENTCPQFKAVPPRMSQEEFAKEQAELLQYIPEELKSTLSYMAYEEGHSAGHEEVIGILKSLVNSLKDPLKQLEARIRKEEIDKFREEYPSLSI